MKVKMPKGTKCMANGGPTGDPKSRKVSSVPAGYKPLKKEGKKEYYYTEKEIGEAKGGSKTKGGPEYETWLQQQLASGVSPEKLATSGYIDSARTKEYQKYYVPDVVYLEPEETQKNPIPLDVDTQINRKNVSVATMPYQSYEYPDVNAGYSKSTTRHFDPKTNREIDPLKSYSTGNYAPTYLYEEGDEKGLPSFGTVRNRSLSSGSIVDDPNYKADTKNAVVNTMDEYKHGGKVKSKWMQHLQTGGGVAAGTSDTTNTKKGGGGGGFGGMMSWMNIANGAQKWGRGMIKREDEIIDPNTGKAYNKTATGEGAIADNLMTPTWETSANTWKSGDDRRKALFFLDPKGTVTNNFVDFSDPNKLKFKTPGDNPEYDAVKDKINSQENINASMNARDMGKTGVISRKEGGPVSKAYERWTSGKAEGGDIKGKGGPKTDSIPSKLAPGGFVVPAENADKAQALREKYFPGTDGKANLKQKGGSPVMVSDGEHYFTPKECMVLKEKGVDLDALAPNADTSDKGKKKGGDIDSMLDSYNTNYLNRRIKEVGREKAIKEYNEIFDEVED